MAVQTATLSHNWHLVCQGGQVVALHNVPAPSWTNFSKDSIWGGAQETNETTQPKIINEVSNLPIMEGAGKVCA